MTKSGMTAEEIAAILDDVSVEFVEEVSKC